MIPRSGFKWDEVGWLSLRVSRMASFLGSHRHTLDAKGRLSIPSKFRKAAGDTFVLTLGLDRCLFLFPEAEWRRLERDLRSLKFTSRDARFFKREMAANACVVVVDNHGRIIVPAELRAEAGLDRDVLVIGAFERIEIWSPEGYRKYREGFGMSYEDVAEMLTENLGGVPPSGDGEDEE